MTQYITQQDLDAASIIIAEDEVEAYLTQANQTLAERIGAEITDSLTDEEIDEMVRVQEAGDPSALQSWLIAHVPELSEIVQDEVDILLGELAAG